MSPSPSTTYFTLTDSNYFLGAVAMINSLAVTGNEGHVVVVDTGLEEWQRERLEPVATIMPLDAPAGLAQAFYKPFVGGSIDGDVVVYVDADVVVTDSLGGVIASAAAGQVVAAPDGQPERFFAEWTELMSLRAPLRRETYVNAGLLAVAPARWPAFFSRWQELCERMSDEAPPMHTLSIEEALVHPGGFHDQDPLNAMLMSECPEGAVALIENGRVVLGAGMPEVELADPATLECRSGGRRTLALHYLNGPKPWQPSGWVVASDDAFILLLMRLLRSDDVPISIADDELPLWLRLDEGVVRKALYAGIRGIRAGSHAFPSSIRRRVRSFIQHR